jgi:hypothetical protein
VAGRRLSLSLIRRPLQTAGVLGVFLNHLEGNREHRKKVFNLLLLPQLGDVWQENNLQLKVNRLQELKFKSEEGEQGQNWSTRMTQWSHLPRNFSLSLMNCLLQINLPAPLVNPRPRAAEGGVQGAEVKIASFNREPRRFLKVGVWVSLNQKMDHLLDRSTLL